MVRIASLLIALAACSGSATSTGSTTSAGGRGAVRADQPPPVPSPGLIVPTNEISPAFRRGLVLADRGDYYAALIELFRVKDGETGESKTMRAVAAYNIATVALELGLYSIAAAGFEAVLDYEPPPELMPSIANGLGALVDRLGERSSSGVEQHVGKLPQSVIDGAAPAVRWQLHYQRAFYAYQNAQYEDARRLAMQVPATARTAVAAANLRAAAEVRLGPREGRGETILRAVAGPTWIGLADLRDRVTAELALLERTEPAFKTSQAMAVLLEELTIQLSLAESDCEKLAEQVRAQAERAEPPAFPLQLCPPPSPWLPPSTVTRVPLRSIAITEPAPPPKPIADRDRDGVPDATDKCPDAIGTGADGCTAKPRDVDGDGVPDRDDRCPGVAGPDRGCPADRDSDGDGVLDSKDRCKAIAGPVGGCPDRDADGIADVADACPDVKGTIVTGARAGCKPLPNPKCARPAKPAGEPAGYACVPGTAKIHVGCVCPADHVETRDDGVALCTPKPAGC